MKLILYLIGRLIVIAFALFVAFLAASTFIGFGLASGMMAEFLGTQGHAEVINTDIGHLAIGIATFVAAVFVSIHLAAFILLPVTIAIAAAEMMRWKSLVANLVLGGICALFTLFAVLASPAEEMPNNGTIIVALAAGFIAAFFYWLIAGRNAGEWLSALGKENSDRES
ncbi:MAG: hypothetical protein AAF423_03490 [Pseudomonadota bacterium]